MGKAVRGYPVAPRSTLRDGVFNVHFCIERIGWINERMGRWGRAMREGKTGEGEDAPGEGGYTMSEGD